MKAAIREEFKSQPSLGHPPPSPSPLKGFPSPNSSSEPCRLPLPSPEPTPTRTSLAQRFQQSFQRDGAAVIESPQQRLGQLIEAGVLAGKRSRELRAKVHTHPSTCSLPASSSLAPSPPQLDPTPCFLQDFLWLTLGEKRAAALGACQKCRHLPETWAGPESECDPMVLIHMARFGVMWRLPRWLAWWPWTDFLGCQSYCLPKLRVTVSWNPRPAQLPPPLSDNATCSGTSLLKDAVSPLNAP